MAEWAEVSHSDMEYYSSYISKLIEQLSRLPGIGAKSAQRLAFHIINMPKEQVEQLAGAMTNARANVRYCKECFTLTDQEICPICANQKRNHKQIMVVENTRDLTAYEKTGKYDGVYHVLHGAISPMLGIGPNDIKLKELMHRLQGICVHKREHKRGHQHSEPHVARRKPRKQTSAHEQFFAESGQNRHNEKRKDIYACV